MHSILDQDIMYLPGVGPRKKEILSKELNIKTFGDLLEYYPYKYVDRTQIFRIAQLQGDMPYVQVKGHILSFEEFDMGPRKKRALHRWVERGRLGLVSGHKIRAKHLQSGGGIHRVWQT